MKKGRPVDSVFIGETLVARVESDISPDRLRIIECTAHRVGGNGPPTSVGLIADGFVFKYISHNFARMKHEW
ncbi:hypothetical protein TELCIR_16440 [Teladorsagia circumcincta]|uniref:Uncharacterized protein n=1 Tax=Teladorsagia circumcincta TaxID=45464 RepID=A0A2G9TVG0_TELCI|nr:hypothetical protein TELCIR_16440 [Teladorsagia circumcincta]